MKYLRAKRALSRISTGEIKWELRPGGMLVQKRENATSTQGMITIRVSTVSQLQYHIPILPTSTFGEMKVVLSLLANLGPKEQRLLFKGKEREDHEHLHMVGVGDKDKVVMLEDPAIKEIKLASRPARLTYHTFPAVHLASSLTNL